MLRAAAPRCVAAVGIFLACILVYNGSHKIQMSIAASNQDISRVQNPSTIQHDPTPTPTFNQPEVPQTITQLQPSQYWQSEFCEDVSDFIPQSSQICTGEDLKDEGGSGKKGIFEFTNGIKICQNYAIMGQIGRYQKSGRHEPEVEKVFEPLMQLAQQRDGDTFVDVGAAIGYYMFLAKKLQPSLRVIGFNPSPDMRDRVNVGFALNFPNDGTHNSSLHRDFICNDPRGMTNEDGKVMMVNNAFAGHLVSEASSKMYAHIKRKAATTVTLTTFLQEIGPVWLLMIDIQGLEAKVLQEAAESGALKTGIIKMFLVGIHGGNLDSVVRILTMANYRILWTFRPGEFKTEPDGLVWAVHNDWDRKQDVISLANRLDI